MLLRNRIPLALKFAYTAFMIVLVPVYWYAYGPTNFLYFCDVALFFARAAVWLESPLLASMPAVGILLPQALWCVDFLGRCVGLEMPGSMTGYMFEGRGLSNEACPGDPTLQSCFGAQDAIGIWLVIAVLML